ncbi:MAG: glycoside hydrolase family 32 protein [Kiritimatiellia bacterium]|nr:glycoside hydrolase family 32 protein [Kiritimatiellia bacterium]MDP6847210.1 glycoside hydrolase family 32 protein [Kiritimatiellia bacterium]
MRKWTLTLVAMMIAASAALAADATLLFENSDFETGTLKNWTAEGEAFKMQPTKGDNPAARGRSDKSNHHGDYWIGTYEAFTGKKGTKGATQGDTLTGRLTSNEFKIEKDFINFLVGAGPHKDTSVRLVVDDKVYYLASGKESETMYAVSANVKKFKGKKAKIVLLDNEAGGWGHINADNFTASEKALAKVIEPIDAAKVKITKHKPRRRGPPLSGDAKTATFKCEKQFILLPIDNNGPKTTISLTVDEKTVRFVTGPLAAKEEDMDWCGFFDISQYRGKEATLNIGGLSDEGFAMVKQADKVPGSENWGDEPKRPQFHFSQRVGWNNDPNGMVYYEGEWHLYLQHNPVGLPWGNMTWAHGVSKDLVSWEHLPNALHHKRGDAMFSGGAAVDWKNHGGWKTGDNDVIIATWTSTGRGECIAYSNDKGRTFTEYEGNPVIRHRGRDPKPVWYEYGKEDTPLNDAAKKLGGHWVIAVFDEKGGRNVAFYTSTDLKEWTEQSHLMGYYECAELYTLAVDGDAGHTHWVVFAADARYAIGDFDGKTFTPEHEGKHRLHHGPYYASQLFSDAPDGRRIQIGWARLGMGDACFNQTFTFPTELTLRTTPDGVRMCGEPVKEIEKIHGKTHKVAGKKLTEESPVEFKTKGALFDIRATWSVGSAKQVGLAIDGREEFLYDVEQAKAKGQPCKIADGKISVQILIDRPMKETFVDNGRIIFTEGYNNDLDIESVNAFARGGEATLVSLKVHELDASWK